MTRLTRSEDIEAERRDEVRDIHREQLAAKDAEIERLTRELSDAKLLAQNNLDWFNQLKPDFDAAIRQRDTLKEALHKVGNIAHAEGDTAGICDIVEAALASLDQPADVAEGEKRD
jgi:uncharacterized protein YhaN